MSKILNIRRTVVVIATNNNSSIYKAINIKDTVATYKVVLAKQVAVVNITSDMIIRKSILLMIMKSQSI